MAGARDALCFSGYTRRYAPWIVLLALMTGALYFTVFSRMAAQWYDDPNHSHGFLVPLLAGYFVYRSRNDVATMAVKPSLWGLPLLVFGVLLLLAGSLCNEYFTMRFSFIVVLSGLIFWLWGRSIFGALALPLCYLVFMIPLPYIVYDAIAFPLKLFVAKYSVVILQALGTVVLREGNLIILPNITLETADACSGLRSLMSLAALSVAFAFLWEHKPLAKAVLVLSTVPVAIFTNGLRVVVTGLLAQYWGARAAEGFFHEFAGLFVFGLALVLIWLVHLALRRWGNKQ